MELTKSDKYHLFGRAQFFIHEENLPEESDVKILVDELFKYRKEIPLSIEYNFLSREEIKKISKVERAKFRSEQRKKVKELNHQWIQNMLHERTGFIEKMTLFWHGHFACRTVDNPQFTLELNNRLRVHGLGSFRTLLLEVSRSAAMISYLHLKQNKKGSPNEDFARELCELFTLGRDVGYTELDIREIARAFTGWTVDERGMHRINKRQRDIGEKIIFGNRGHFGGEDVIDLILENKNTARFVSRKVYRSFVREEINEKHIEILATAFYDSNYDIAHLMRTLFTADWFYESKGELIKSPLDLIVGLGKAFDLKYEDSQSLIRVQRYLGQVLFDPPNVAGWKGGRSWIDASRLAFRLRMGSMILSRGVVAMDENSTALDDASPVKNKKNRALKLYEEVNWKMFWKRNPDFYSALLRVENPHLNPFAEEKMEHLVIQLISTPDFQLI